MADQVGKWTMSVPAITRDELHVDVIALAKQCGYRQPWDEVARLNRYQAHYNDFYPVLGTGSLPDPAWAGDLEAMARRALDWMNEHAPPGRRFRLAEALYCDAA